MKIKKQIDLLTIFWILQSIVLFTMTGFGLETKLLSIVLFGLSVTNIIINNKTFKFTYSIVLLLYSMMYMLIVITIYIFSNNRSFNIIAPIALGILNFFLVFIYWRKLKRIQ